MSAAHVRIGRRGLHAFKKQIIESSHHAGNYRREIRARARDFGCFRVWSAYPSAVRASAFGPL